MNKKYKYLILGAGPAGLTFASILKKRGETSFLIIEKEKVAGGLCKSITVDDAPLDIGGGHFLDADNKEAVNYLFEYMPAEEWNLFDRISKIAIDNHVIDHPFEANIWQFPERIQKIYLESIALAKCNTGEPMPSKFVEWITWKLGDKIANDYMLPYNKKLFADNLDELGTYWLNKLPDVSYEETLLSCKMKKMYGKQPGHAKFYYPKEFGYGEVWQRIGETLKEHIVYDQNVLKLNISENYVVTKGGERFDGKYIITTIPWTSISNIYGMPEELKNKIKELKHSSIKVDYYNKNIETDAHWIYTPDDKVAYHRILVRHNFCADSRGYWTESRTENETSIDENNASKFCYVNNYAYPLNLVNKPEIIQNILSFAREKNIYGLGRWGEHEHYNSDVTVSRAISLANCLYVSEGRL